jgi:hypothetical protein
MYPLEFLSTWEERGKLLLAGMEMAQQRRRRLAILAHHFKSASDSSATIPFLVSHSLLDLFFTSSSLKSVSLKP